MIYDMEKSLQNVKKLVKPEVKWIRDMCKQLVQEGVNPNLWDEMICKAIPNATNFRGIRIVRLCEQGYYKNIGEKAYEIK